MDGSDEAEQLAEGEKLEDVEVVEISGSGPSRAARRTPRKCVQKKLHFYLPTRGDGREDGGKEDAGSSSSEEEVKRKPRRKARTGRADKVPVTFKDTGLNTQSKRSPPTVVKGSFFLRVSEKKLKQKHHIELEDNLVESEVDGGTENCEVTEIQNSDLQSNKSPLSCHLKGLPTKWWLNRGKTTAKDYRPIDLDEPKPIIDLSPNEMNVDISSEGIRPIHPFFSHQKTKKVSKPSLSLKSNRKNYSEPGDNRLSSCPPIHVSDFLQDGISSLDWGRWEICENSLLNRSEFSATECSFLFNCGASIGPLKLDSIIPFLKVCEDTLSCRNMQPNEDTLDLLVDKRQSNIGQDLQDKNDHALASESIIYLDNSQDEQNDGLSTKSAISNKKHRFTKGHLWTNKHKPEKAAEVCGNAGAIKFLVEWLSSWQERHSRATKNYKSKFVCIDEDINEIESDSDDRFDSDFDSENEDEHSLRNVLVVTGPVGCGKTAAIYASAKELKFNVIEVNASDVRTGAHIKQKFGEAMDSHRIELCSGIDTAKPSTSQESFKQTSTVPESANFKGPGTASESQGSTCRVANMNLLLFEDADAILHEDRGFFTTIMQLAETSKRPIILTTNSKDLNLPRALDKQVVAFSCPSTEELLSCLLQLCSSEGANVSPQLLEQLIIRCQGDIRKTILLLQFWCQGGKYQPDRSMRLTYSPLQFDLDAAHRVIENVLPWEIPCELTLKIEEEISKTVSCLEGNNENFHKLTEKINAESTVANQILQSGECLSPGDDDMGFLDDLGSPLTFLERGSNKRRFQTVMSSSEEDTTLPFDRNTTLTSGSQLTGDEVISCSHVCDTYNSFCPETEITNRDDVMSVEVNSHQFSIRDSGDEQDYDDNKTIMIGDEDTRMNFLNMEETNGESGHGMGSSREAYQIMDECSCVGFNIGLKSVDRSTSQPSIDPVDQKWKSLRSCSEDFKLDSSFGHKDGIRILNLTSSLTHLISDADILLRQCQLLTREVMEVSETPHDEPCSSSWYSEHLEMSSIFSQHGLCFYASKAVTPSSNFCYETSFHLAHEMLASSSCSMALGKLLSQQNNISVVCGERGIQKKTSRELGSNISNAVRPMIPERLQMMLHGQDLLEYISSLSFISKVENSRLSESTDNVRSLRRARTPRHYLRSLPVTLSPEKMEFFAGYGCFGSPDIR